MVFGDEAVGRLRVDEVMRVGSHDGISALVIKRHRAFSLSLPHHERTQREGSYLQARERALTRP